MHSSSTASTLVSENDTYHRANTIVTQHRARRKSCIQAAPPKLDSVPLLGESLASEAGDIAWAGERDATLVAGAGKASADSTFAGTNSID